MQKRVKILDGEWKNTFVAECMDFPTVDHDDQVDAMSLIGRQYSSIPTPTRESDKKVEIDFFLKEKDGQIMTTVGLDTMFNENDKSGVLNVARRRF